LHKTNGRNQTLREIGKERQSCDSFASAKVERDTLLRNPM